MIRVSLCFVAFALFSLSLLGSVNATSWVDLKPEEVIERSTVIVQGKYDFSHKRKGSNFIWVGYDFKVERVYRGGVPSTIIAGIDGFDVGWVDEIQQADGSFVLFLEQSDKMDYLTPVGGPNGMIHIQNNEVQHHDEYEKSVFTNFLNNTKSYAPHPDGKAESIGNSNIFLIIVICLLLLLSIVYFVYRNVKLRKNRP
ncbi:hypothetical protein [Paenibacillus alkalitolerans]|uniref:hypothetical protein n=1 Tax=Paenibacillus alkalitolerans TaxID=2799335 RepID=UPI0018F55474|nr:hypothetical protein [Paenibacillus alkalitolerans]